MGKQRSSRATSIRTAAGEPAADDVGATVSHPERVVYQQPRLTKQDVADYYNMVSLWLLPEIVDRPLSVVRCPQGIDRPCFFQKHASAGMDDIDRLPLREKDGGEDEYLVVRDLEGLHELVQFNALELHPWGALAEQPDLADRVVFDLDPGDGIDWRQIRDAARQVRARLQHEGLTSYVRTTGGKGLHVVLPLRPTLPWEQVRQFARQVAESMVAGQPQHYVASASKQLRDGRIFLDYLRNGRGATSIASLSLRARPGAPVAMPLRWEELDRVTSGAAFHLQNTPSRLRRLKSHPWHGIDTLQQGLPERPAA